jgi:hypothetical protein
MPIKLAREDTLRFRLFVIGAALAGSACSTTKAFQVGVFGDIPYVRQESERAAKLSAYGHLLRSVDAADVDFVVHIGDFAYAEQCSDSVYVTRQAEFARVAHPLIYLFGDNEWVDCRTPYEAPERLARLRDMFTRPGSGSLGARTMPVTRQQGWPENVRWQLRGVTFAAVNVVGSNNNWGSDSLPSAEWRARNNANVAWLREAFAQAARTNAPGIAIFMQANPLPSAAARAARPNGFGELMAVFRELAIAFDKPVALVHGDTHYFRVDKPFADSASARTYARITRAETFGDPNSHWLILRVDPRSADVFSFQPVVIPENLLRAK